MFLSDFARETAVPSRTAASQIPTQINVLSIKNRSFFISDKKFSKFIEFDASEKVVSVSGGIIIKNITVVCHSGAVPACAEITLLRQGFVVWTGQAGVNFFVAFISHLG